MSDPILSIQNLVGGYGKMTILNGTTFSVPPATITTIIGPNGAGKSTVFKAIFGLLRLREGKISFAGRDVTPFEDDPAFAQLQQAEDRLEHGGFAGAVRADHGGDGARRHREGGAVEDRHLAVAADKALNIQNGVAHGSIPQWPR